MAKSLLTFLVSRNKKAVIHARRSIGHFGLKPAMPRGGTIDFTGVADGPNPVSCCGSMKCWHIVVL